MLGVRSPPQCQKKQMTPHTFLALQLWVAYAPCGSQHKDAVQITLEQIDLIKRLIEQYSSTLHYVTSSEGQFWSPDNLVFTGSLLCRPGGGSQGWEDSQCDLCGVWAQYRDKPSSVEDVLQAWGQVPHSHSQLQQSMGRLQLGR